MQIEQIQFLLPDVNDSSQSSSTAPPDANQASQKQKKVNNAMNIVSNNPSMVESVDSQTNAPIDTSFSNNFKILNISSLKSPEHVLPNTTQ